MASPTLALSPQQMRRLRVVSVLGGRTPGRVGVAQLPGGIIRKSFNLKDPLHASAFSREVQILDRLRGCEFAPQLLFVDMQRGDTYYQSPGPRVSPLSFIFSSADVNRQRDHILTTLESKYGIVRASRANPDLKTRRLPARFLRRNPQTKAIAVDGFDDPSWKLLPLE